MDGQKPCVNCLHAIKVEWSKFLTCSIDNRFKLGLFDCEHFASKKELHERAENFRKMINSLTDEQIAFMYFR